MQTINWECIAEMLRQRSETLRDGEEYISWALSFCRDRLAVCEANGHKPNFKMLISWSIQHWFRLQAKTAAEINFSDEVDFIDERAKPDEYVMVKLDTLEFLKALKPTQRTVLSMLLQGYKPLEIAKAMRLTSGRISQVRSELRAAALEFIPEYC